VKPSELIAETNPEPIAKATFLECPQRRVLGQALDVASGRLLASDVRHRKDVERVEQ
jgi:hypothetical protein